MAKFIVLIAAVIALVLPAEASPRYTVITTIEELNQGCSTEIERYSEGLGNCVIFLYRGLSEETPVGIEEYCCKTLRKINDQKCRCEAISKIVKSIKETGGGSRWRSLSEEQRRKLIQSAASLPSTCKLQQGCQIQSSSAVF